MNTQRNYADFKRAPLTGLNNIVMLGKQNTHTPSSRNIFSQNWHPCCLEAYEHASIIDSGSCHGLQRSSATYCTILKLPRASASPLCWLLRVKHIHGALGAGWANTWPGQASIGEGQWLWAEEGGLRGGPSELGDLNWILTPIPGPTGMARLDLCQIQVAP